MRSDQVDFGKGFFRQLNLHGIGVVQRRIDHQNLAVILCNAINNVGGGGDQIQIVFPLQPFLNDFHMQKTQKAAAETETKGDGTFQFISKRGVIELQLFQGFAQVLVFGTVSGVYAGEDHGLYGAVAGQGFGSTVFHCGDGITYLCVGNGFDGGGDITDFACA